MSYKDPEKEKECQRQYYLRHKDKVLAASKKRYHEKKEEILRGCKDRYNKDTARITQRNKNYRARNRGKYKEYEWRCAGMVNMTMERYDQLFQEQNGSCAICRIGAETLSRNLVVDHNHETGKVRGLLCDHCNQGIGKLKDNIIILERAIEYLNRS